MLLLDKPSVLLSDEPSLLSSDEPSVFPSNNLVLSSESSLSPTVDCDVTNFVELQGAINEDKINEGSGVS